MIVRDESSWSIISNMNEDLLKIMSRWSERRKPIGPFVTHIGYTEVPWRIILGTNCISGPMVPGPFVQDIPWWADSQMHYSLCRGGILERNGEFSSLLSQSQADFTPPPPPEQKWVENLKLVCNVNIVYGNFKSENSQAYDQKPQRNCAFMNSASGKSHCRKIRSLRRVDPTNETSSLIF
jgi:hypothetical protein